MSEQITLKDEQGKKVGTVQTLEQAIRQAWKIRGRLFTNPVITFHRDGEKVGQYPPSPQTD